MVLILDHFVPQHRPERRALVVERKSVPDLQQSFGRIAVGKAHRPDPFVDRNLELVDRHAVGVDRVPYADKANVREHLLAFRLTQIQIDGGCWLAFLVFEVFRRTKNPTEMMVDHATLLRRADQEIALIRLVGHLHASDQFGLTIRFEKPALADQTHQQADGEGAPAETEAINLIPIIEVAAYESVDVADVGPNPDAERAAERSDRLEVLGADTIVIINKLLGSLWILCAISHPLSPAGPRVLARVPNAKSYDRAFQICARRRDYPGVRFRRRRAHRLPRSGRRAA